MKGLRRTEKDDGVVEEMESEASQEVSEDGGGGEQTKMSCDPYFSSLQGESARQKNLSACTQKKHTYTRIHTHTQQYDIAAR